MNIVAVSIMSEFITLEPTDGGGIDLVIELARMQVTEDGHPRRGEVIGSIQLHLLPADVDTITTRLAEIVSGLQHSTRV